jgi:spermidine synthase
MTFVIFASVLYAVCITYFVLRKKKLIRASVTAAVALALGLASTQIGTAFWQTDLLYEGESIYNYLRVEETESSVILSTNVLFGVQSIQRKSGGLTGMYYDYALAAPAMAGGAANGENLSVLILGLGTGTYATQCEKYYGISQIDGVEIDEKIVELAYEYFDLPACVTPHIADGRAFLDRCEKKYDVIMVDAYQDITIPFQMSTTEFFTMVKEHLEPDGVMVVNLNMHSGDADSINAHLSDTIASVFTSVYTADVPGTTNRELFAWNGAVRTLSEVIPEVEDFRLASKLAQVEGDLAPYKAGGLILTDDKAPVELLGMRVIDDLITEELAYYKRILDRDGLGGLIRSLIGG